MSHTSCPHCCLYVCVCICRADSGSLALLNLLISQETAPLLLLGAYRDNEVDANHPLQRLIDEAKLAAPGQVTEVKLKPLSTAHIVQLLKDSFRCDEAAATPFAALLNIKTQGVSGFCFSFFLTILSFLLARVLSESGRVGNWAQGRFLVLGTVSMVLRRKLISVCALFSSVCVFIIFCFSISFRIPSF